MTALAVPSAPSLSWGAPVMSPTGSGSGARGCEAAGGRPAAQTGPCRAHYAPSLHGRCLRRGRHALSSDTPPARRCSSSGSARVPRPPSRRVFGARLPGEHCHLPLPQESCVSL